VSVPDQRSGPVYLIGMDLGTTNIKGLVFTTDGRIVASASRPTPTHYRGTEVADFLPRISGRKSRRSCGSSRVLAPIPRRSAGSPSPASARPGCPGCPGQPAGPGHRLVRSSRARGGGRVAEPGGRARGLPHHRHAHQPRPQSGEDPVGEAPHAGGVPGHPDLAVRAQLHRLPPDRGVPCRLLAGLPVHALRRSPADLVGADVRPRRGPHEDPPPVAPAAPPSGRSARRWRAPWAFRPA